MHGQWCIHKVTSSRSVSGISEMRGRAGGRAGGGGGGGDGGKWTQLVVMNKFHIRRSKREIRADLEMEIIGILRVILSAFSGATVHLACDQAIALKRLRSGTLSLRDSLRLHSARPFNPIQF